MVGGLTGLEKAGDSVAAALTWLSPRAMVKPSEEGSGTGACGSSQVSAAATLSPAFSNPVSPPTTPPAVTPPSSSQLGGGGTGATLPTEPTGPAGSSQPAPVSTPVVAQPKAATAFGLPVRTAWVVISFLLALLLAGLLLSYANWQLLRGRTP